MWLQQTTTEATHDAFENDFSAYEFDSGHLATCKHEDAGDECRPAAGSAAQGTSAADGVTLTLVCLANGAAEVEVPHSAAAQESELVRTHVDDEDDAPRLDLHALDGAAAAAFADFLRHGFADFLRHSTAAEFLGDGGCGFAALHAAASYLIAPRWQVRLVDAWVAAVAGAKPRALALAVNVAAAALDPAVSPLLRELPLEALGRILNLIGRAPGWWRQDAVEHTRQEACRRIRTLPDLALAKLREPVMVGPARAELRRRHPQLKPFDSDSLKAAVERLRTEHRTSASCSVTETEYGPLALWDTSQVTDMNQLFGICYLSMDWSTNFTADLSAWDVGRVEMMGSMFSGASAFTCDLSGWDVGRVSDMSFMFCGASAFTSNLSAWNIGRVRHMEKMFCGASVFSAQDAPWYVERAERPQRTSEELRQEVEMLRRSMEAMEAEEAARIVHQAHLEEERSWQGQRQTAVALEKQRWKRASHHRHQPRLQRRGFARGR